VENRLTFIGTMPMKPLSNPYGTKGRSRSSLTRSRPANTVEESGWKIIAELYTNFQSVLVDNLVEQTEMDCWERLIYLISIIGRYGKLGALSLEVRFDRLCCRSLD